jgi:adenylate cyclase class 2
MRKQEIELKLPIKDKRAIVRALHALGAVVGERVTQTDILYCSKYFNFRSRDHVLRIRIERSRDRETATLGFKGTPRHTSDGHRIRDEWETSVNPRPMRKILTSVGFEEGAVMKKKREHFTFNGVDIAIDEFPFGTFIELEGLANKIEAVRKGLGLQHSPPIMEGYIFLQERWEAKRGKSKAGV